MPRTDIAEPLMKLDADAVFVEKFQWEMRPRTRAWSDGFPIDANGGADAAREIPNCSAAIREEKWSGR